MVWKMSKLVREEVEEGEVKGGGHFRMGASLASLSLCFLLSITLFLFGFKLMRRRRRGTPDS